MKKVFLFMIAVAAVTASFAQSERYINAMKTNIAKLDSGLIRNNLGELSNNFERIAAAEKSEWLPYYYAAYCTVMQALMEQDKSKSDAIADKAEALVTKAEAIAGKENSELLVIRSMIASAHLMVDPQSRWQQYGPASTENMMKARQLDPKNPRPVYLEGQAKFYTPESFGGGKVPARELFQQALQMFDNFQPASSIHPSWGKAATLYFLAQTNAGK
jgi:hypothetical protein